eukprot:PITA_05622
MDFGKVVWTCYLLVFVALLSHTEAAPANARITSVPGYSGTLPSDHYGGYVKIDETSGKYLYYYFITSERNATTDPVVLWLNGGPGGSSFDGFVYEHGPFNFEAGENGNLPRLKLNPYSWSKVSNIIYLDSPCGVGYSYSENVSDYDTGDLQTASDTHDFLLKWFEEYPEFVSNPFYIIGESYAGIYVPTLASEVVKGIEAGVKPVLNWKGYAIGNAYTDPKFDDNSFVPFAHGMGLISDDQYQEAFHACKGNYYDVQDDDCERILHVILETVSRLHVYNILEPCYLGTEMQEVRGSKENLPESFKLLGQTHQSLPVRRSMFGSPWEDSIQMFGRPWQDIKCMDMRIATIWCNDESVRKAIHAQTEEIAGIWRMASHRLHYHFFGAGSMIVYHKNLTMATMIYYNPHVCICDDGGDHDLEVPFTGTQAWIRSLGYAIIDKWHPWIVDDQVAGYTQGYDHNLTFATIKGSGHTVPQYKPKEALAFYTRWLAGKSL